MTSFDLAAIFCPFSEPEPLNAVESIADILQTASEQEPLEGCFWEQSETSCPWNIYWTDAARETVGLDIDDLVFAHIGWNIKDSILGCCLIAILRKHATVKDTRVHEHNPRSYMHKR